MSYETLRWMMVAHIFGFTIWIGAMLALANTLGTHVTSDAAAGGALVDVERKLAITMDVGACIAIVFGMIMLFGIEPSPLHQGGWMHMKLTAVLAVLGLHGFLRVKVKKFKKGETPSVPTWIVPAIALLLLAIVIFVIVKPTAK